MQLYFSRYRKRLINEQYGCSDEIIKEVNEKKNFSCSWLRKMINHLTDRGILEETEFRAGKICYSINRKAILQMLNDDEIYNDVFKIVEDKYFIFPK